MASDTTIAPCAGARYTTPVQDVISTCPLRHLCERFLRYPSSALTPIVARWRGGYGGEAPWCWDFDPGDST